MKSNDISSRKQSFVEVAEAHFDKNTVILCVNVLILIILVSILYIIASSAMNVGNGIQNSLSQKHNEH